MKGGWLNWVVLGLLFTLLSSTQSTPIDVDYCLRVLSTEDECEWYVECLERLFQCGKNGYPIEYGYKYCKKFNSAALSPQGKIWVNATTICLKQSLLPLIESKLKGHHYSCPELKRLAFDSHPRCYTSSGFCQLFTKGIKQDVKVLSVFLNVLQIKDFLGYLAYQQIYIVLKTCLSSYLSAD